MRLHCSYRILQVPRVTANVRSTWRLMGKRIQEVEYWYDIYPEQTAIGSLFRTLDDLLASYQNQSCKLPISRRPCSQMFPKAGQTVPEIRLDGFEDWMGRNSRSKLVKELLKVLILIHCQRLSLRIFLVKVN